MLIDGGPWWAMVEVKGNSTDITYWKVIAWESLPAVKGRDGDDDEPHRLVAWINGREPVRSDQFYERVSGFVLNQFVDRLPERARTNSWA